MSKEVLATILLVVDGSEASIAAANYAVALVAQTGGKLVAMHVVDTATMEYLMQMRIFVSEEREEFERDLAQTGRKYLDYVKAVASKECLEIETLQTRGAFHQCILQEARRQDVDAIVLGGWRRTVMAKDATSVERQLILDDAECPVIVVKAKAS